MFDRVGDIGLVAVDAGFVQGAVEDFAGRADERPPGEILPNTLCAAVAPIATTSTGSSAARSRSYHGRHALISGVVGFWCRRILPRGTNLKCLTALVT